MIVFQVIAVIAFVLSVLFVFGDKKEKKYLWLALITGSLFILSELVEKLLP